MMPRSRILLVFMLVVASSLLAQSSKAHSESAVTTTKSNLHPIATASNTNVRTRTIDSKLYAPRSRATTSKTTTSSMPTEDGDISQTTPKATGPRSVNFPMTNTTTTSSNTPMALDDSTGPDVQPVRVQTEASKTKASTATLTSAPATETTTTITTTRREPDPTEEEVEQAKTIQPLPTTQIPFNATALSFSACQKLDMAISLLTSLDFQKHLQKTVSFSFGEDTTVDLDEHFYSTVYVLLMILAPISLGLLLFGARLFLHTCILCAAAVGLFSAFGVMDSLLPIAVDCPMKLALAVVAAFLCAVTATACFRFALFCFGFLTVAGAFYVTFDSFPNLDPGVVVYSVIDSAVGGGIAVGQTTILPTSDLSAVAWLITTSFGIGGGIILRYYEQATLEVLTAGMGGVGCAYSAHTIAMVKGLPLHPSVVFLLAFFMSFGGWKFQSRRRQPRYIKLDAHHLPTSQIQLQLQLEAMRGLLPSHIQHTKGENPVSPDHIADLTRSINTFLETMHSNNKSSKANKDS